MDTHRRAIITAIAALCATAVQRAPAQSSGSFAGDFVGDGVNIISTITCSSGAALSCVNGGSAFLGATIKMPGSRSKYLWISASLETALWTQTGVTGGTGKIQTSTATGSIVVTPEVRAPNGALMHVWPPSVTFDERTQQLAATPRDATRRTITAVATDGPPRDDLDHHLTARGSGRLDCGG